ncbi:hypothetical protein [uncultured Roseovarius sp.]|uniref:hypothetical protein n=1 Tax=uncultured Roseovarius sp. TaxID=293344 RepID=UPI00260BCE12|nr:hypothetical protein [uncultured Roseovarius sp.]
MKALNSRLLKLELRAAEIAARNPDGNKLWERLEEVASRLDWNAMTPDWVAGQSVITIIVAGFHCPQPLPDAVKSRVQELALSDDTVGKLAKLILEFSE